MIDYQTYCQIRHLFTEQKLGLRQIARELKLGLNTVCKWARRESFKRAPIPKRASKLDPFKGEIIRPSLANTSPTSCTSASIRRKNPAPCT